MMVWNRRAEGPPSRTVIIAKSPVQLALSYEVCRARYKNPVTTVLLSRHGGFDQYEAVLELYEYSNSKVYRIFRWPGSAGALIGHIRRLARALGSPLSNDTWLHLRMARAWGMSVSFVDNGLGSQRTLDWLDGASLSASEQGPSRRASFHPYREVPPPRYSSLFTCLPLNVPTSLRSRVTLIGFPLLRNKYLERSAPTSGCWILGQPLTAFGVMSEAAYAGRIQASLDALARKHPRIGRAVYFPHPSEDSGDVERLTLGLGLPLKRFQSGAEFELMTTDSPPSVVIAPYSSALCTFPHIAGDGQERYFWPPSSIKNLQEPLKSQLNGLVPIFERSGAKPLF